MHRSALVRIPVVRIPEVRSRQLWAARTSDGRHWAHRKHDRASRIAFVPWWLLALPACRVDAADAIQEWGDWAFVDNGKGAGLMLGRLQPHQCRDPPVLYRPLPWGTKRSWR